MVAHRPDLWTISTMPTAARLRVGWETSGGWM